MNSPKSHERTKTSSTQTFELSDVDTQEAIAEWIEKRFGKGQPLNVEIRIRTERHGYGDMGPDTHVGYVVATRPT